MDLALTETQTLLQNTAIQFMEEEMPKSRVLEIDDSPSGFSLDLWEKMCQLGWCGMLIPEEYGGSENTFTDLAVIYEVMGLYACPSPHLSSAVLCAQAILEAGDDSQKQQLLPLIASGQQIFAMALIGSLGGWLRHIFFVKEMNAFNLVGLALVGFFSTFMYDVFTLIAYPLAAGLGLPGIMAALVKGLGFTLLHEISNAVVFVIAIPNVVKHLK